VIEVGLFAVKVAAIPSNVTAVAPVKLLPVMVTVVPPSVGPTLGEIAVTTGAGGTKLNRELPTAVPPGVVTRTSTAPAACGGVTAVIEVRLVTVKLAAAVPPNVTAITPVKFLPAMMTLVPPAVGPLFGETEATVGAPMKVKASLAVPEPPVAVTPTSTVPAICAGVTAVIDVALVTVKLAAGNLPNVTAVVPVKPLPVIVTVVPPSVGPLFGETEVTVGAPI
jgi:hypothetical protein